MVLTLAGTSFSVQNTMVVPLLPSLQREFETTTAWAAWLMVGYLLVAAVATPLVGRLGDQFGKARLLTISLMIFCVGSVGAALAPSLPVLAVTRGVQGIAGAVFPLGFAILKDEFPSERVPGAAGVLSATLAVGSGFGLVFAGVGVEVVSWRYLFGLCAIWIAATAVLVHRFIPESPTREPARLDVIGALLLSSGLVALLLGITESSRRGWLSIHVLGLIAVAAVLLAIWLRVERRRDSPMVDIGMLSRRPVLLTNVTALVGGYATIGSFVLIPTFIEMPYGLPADEAALVDYGFGLSPAEAALLMLPGPLVGVVSSLAGTRLGRRFGRKWALAAGLASSAGGLACLAVWHSELWHVVLAMVLLGTGGPMTFAALATLIVASVKPTETGIATGMNMLVRMVGGVLGAQVGASILTADTIGSTSVPGESAFVTAFAVGALSALGAAVLATTVTPRARARARSSAAVVPQNES